MKTLLATFFVFFLSFLHHSYSQSKNSKSQEIKSNIGSHRLHQLSTDIRFDDLSLTGKKQSPLGAQAIVENEKNIPQLIDFRNDYDDRIVRSQQGR